MALSKEQMKKIDEEILASPAPNELTTCILLANTIDIIINDVDYNIRKAYANNGVQAKPKNGETLLSGLARYTKAIKNVAYWFERDIEPRIEDATFESYGVDSYDSFRYSANMLAQLNLLYVDRCKIEGNMEKIKEFIETLPSGDRFTAELIERFKLK